MFALRYPVAVAGNTYGGDKMIFPLNGNLAGLYMRLSRDEDANKESNSISNQRKILTDYAQRGGFTVISEYIDDGYSGANFKRPGFTQMMEDARNGWLVEYHYLLKQI